MNSYHKAMAFFAYLFGIIAFLAILVNDKKNALFSFHVWQAFILNIVISILAVLVYALWLPKYILTIDIYSRTNFFLLTTLIPCFIIFIGLLVFGIMAAKQRKFSLPLIGYLAKKITEYKE